MAEFKYAGSISSGTMRSEDLIPKFLEVLRDMCPAEYSYLARLYGIKGDENWELEAGKRETDELDWLLNGIQEILNNEAPEGYYFGASEGDGADYGFWEVES